MSVDCAPYGPRLPYINPGVKNEWVPLPLLKKFERVPTPKIPWWRTLSNVGSSPHPHTSPYSWKSKTCIGQCLWPFVLSTFVYQVSPEEIIYYTTFSLHYIYYLWWILSIMFFDWHQMLRNILKLYPSW